MRLVAKRRQRIEEAPVTHLRTLRFEVAPRHTLASAARDQLPEDVREFAVPGTWEHGAKLCVSRLEILRADDTADRLIPEELPGGRMKPGQRIGEALLEVLGAEAREWTPPEAWSGARVVMELRVIRATD